MTPIAHATHPEEVAASLHSDEDLHVLLDYDGTLVPFAATPDLARPDPELLDLLHRFAGRRGTQIEVVSGRDRDTLGEWLGGLPITLRAEHGMWTHRHGDAGWAASLNVHEGALEQATAMIKAVQVVLGGLVERKRAGVAWHYRGIAIPKERIDDVAAQLAADVEVLGFEVLRGSCVVELRAHGIDKGHAVREARERRPAARILALGDDVTDEDMFRQLVATDLGLLVGETGRATAARLRLSSVAAARILLRILAG